MKASSRALVVAVCALVFFFAWPGGLRAQTISTTQTFCPSGSACVWTYHNDNSRDGVNQNETTLTPSYVQGHTFTATAVSTDGLIYAQPLYIHQLYKTSGNGYVGSCPASKTTPINVVFVATENNSVYAFDTLGNQCWKTSLDRSLPSESALAFSNFQVDGSNNHVTDLVPQSGITGTPVIDFNVTPPILYVVTAHQINSGGFAHGIHAIDTTTGIELFPGGTSISDNLGTNFHPRAQKQRAGTALFYSNGVAYVYAAFGSYGDSNSPDIYNGWVAEFKLDYNHVTNGLQYVAAFTSETPVGQANAGGIWMGGTAPAIDDKGNVYLGVGNGTLTPPSLTTNTWGNSVLKLQPAQSAPVLDFYTPNDFAQLNNGTNGQKTVCFGAPACPPGALHPIIPDTDMGTGGVVMLSPSELVAIGKQGILYVIPYDDSSTNHKMGGLDGCGYSCSTGWSNYTNQACSVTGSGSIKQCFPAVPFSESQDANGLWGAPVFWGGSSGTTNLIYMTGIKNSLRAYLFSSSTGAFDSANPLLPDMPHTFGYPGGATSLTSNGTDAATGVLWALDNSGYGHMDYQQQQNGWQLSWTAANPAVLYAYKANPDSNNHLDYLWDSSKLTNYSTIMPGAVKFVQPTIADGYIFVAGGEPGYFGTPVPNCPFGTTFSCEGWLTIIR